MSATLPVPPPVIPAPEPPVMGTPFRPVNADGHVPLNLREAVTATQQNLAALVAYGESLLEHFTSAMAAAKAEAEAAQAALQQSTSAADAQLGQDLTAFKATTAQQVAGLQADITAMATEADGATDDLAAATQAALNLKADKTALAQYARLDGAVFTSPPVVPAGTADNHAASRLYVNNQVGTKAPLNNPFFSGTVQAPHPVWNANNQVVPTTQWVLERITAAFTARNL